MTEAEIFEALEALQNECGPLAIADLAFKVNARPAAVRTFHVCLRPLGEGNEAPWVFGRGDSGRAAIADARAKWLAEKDAHRAELLNRMALAIIDITARQGACSDAALRAENFHQSDIAELGAEACAEAERMASSGPFVIVATPQSNAD